MRDPRAVEARARLAGLVLAHLRERALVGLGVAPARDEGGHPPDRERPAPVAGRDQQVAVGPHHRRGHGDRAAVGEGVRRAGVAEVLDDAEQVVPPTRVESGDVVAQCVQDLLHLERRGDRLDEDRRADHPVGHLQGALGVREDVVPQLRLVVGLQLGQVEVRPAAAGEELAGVVEEVQPEVDQRGDHRPPVDAQVLLVEVPAARPRHDHRDRVGVAQRVVLALGRGEGDRAADRVVQVDLAADHVDPVRGVRVLQVGEPDLGARVERVDRHLALGRPGDLDTTVLQVGWGPARPATRRPGSLRSPAGSPGCPRRPAPRAAGAGPRAARRVDRRNGGAGRPRSRARRASGSRPTGRRRDRAP